MAEDEWNIREAKEHFKKWRQGTFKVFKGYKFDRVIIQTALILMLAVMFYFVYSHNFDLDFYSCDNQDGLCKNPFYKHTTWKNLEYLQPGEYGVPMDWLPKIQYFSLLLFITAFGINHLIHNRRYKFIGNKNNRKNIEGKESSGIALERITENEFQGENDNEGNGS